MKNLFEKLQDYFNNTSEEQVLKDWNSTAEYDEINSPLIQDFINTTNYFWSMEYDPLEEVKQNNLSSTIQNPNFSSDFSFI